MSVVSGFMVRYRCEKTNPSRRSKHRVTDPTTFLRLKCACALHYMILGLYSLKRRRLRGIGIPNRYRSSCPPTFSICPSVPLSLTTMLMLYRTQQLIHLSHTWYSYYSVYLRVVAINIHLIWKKKRKLKWKSNLIIDHFLLSAEHQIFCHILIFGMLTLPAAIILSCPQSFMYVIHFCNPQIHIILNEYD